MRVWVLLILALLSACAPALPVPPTVTPQPAPELKLIAFYSPL